MKIIQINIYCYLYKTVRVSQTTNQLYNQFSVNSQTESKFTPDTTYSLAEESNRKVHDRRGYTHCRSSIDVPRLSGNTGMV